MTTAAVLTDSAFAADVVAHPGIVLVDVWAEWCTPCRALGKLVDQLAVEYDGRVRVMKLDADANSETVARFEVRALPTVLLFERGALVHQFTGAQSRQAYSSALDALLAGEALPVAGTPAAPPAMQESSVTRAHELLATDLLTLLFKHSVTCPISVRAKTHYDRFVSAHPEVPTELIIVQQDRAVSNAVADLSRVRHESPQALLVKDGACLWDASHDSITVTRMEEAFARFSTPLPA